MLVEKIKELEVESDQTASQLDMDRRSGEFIEYLDQSIRTEEANRERAQLRSAYFSAFGVDAESDFRSQEDADDLKQNIVALRRNRLNKPIKQDEDEKRNDEEQPLL